MEVDHSFSIRPAAATDAADVANIYLESRQRLVPFAPLVYPDAAVRLWVKDHLIPGSNVAVAVLGDNIVGMCATSEDDTAGWIDQLYLQPEYIGKRIGTVLLFNAMRNLRFPIRLYTFQENDRARRFYEQHGFVAIQFGDGSGNEESVPDVLYERSAPLLE